MYKNVNILISNNIVLRDDPTLRISPLIISRLHTRTRYRIRYKCDGQDFNNSTRIIKDERRLRMAMLFKCLSVAI